MLTNLYSSKVLHVKEMCNSGLTRSMPPVSFHTPLKTSENQMLSDTSSDHKKRLVVWNWLMRKKDQNTFLQNTSSDFF